MSETHRPRRIGRSIGALLAGFLAVIILSLGTDIVLRAVGVLPPLGQPMAGRLFLLATAYRTVYGVAGSTIAARLAPSRPMAHGLALGVVGVAVSIVGAVATWNRGPNFGPHCSLAKPGEDRIGPDKQRDRFQLHLGNLLGAKIGRDVSNLCVAMTIVSRDGKDVCLVHASPSPTPVYIADPKPKAFYLRVGPATVGLEVEEAVAYCRERWPAPLLARVLRPTRSR